MQNYVTLIDIFYLNTLCKPNISNLISWVWCWKMSKSTDGHNSLNFYGIPHKKLKRLYTSQPKSVHVYQRGLDARKTVFGVSDNARLKPVSLATETCYKNENSISEKQRPWSRPVCAFVLRKHLRQVFSRWGPNNKTPAPVLFKIILIYFNQRGITHQQ